MFKTDNLLKRLFRLSLYTSLLLAVVSVTPFLSLQKILPPAFYVFFIVSLYLTVFVIWQINILLVFLYDKYKVKHEWLWTRYLLSSVLSVTVAGLLIHGFHSIPMAEKIRIASDLTNGQKDNWYSTVFSTFFINLFVVFIQEVVLLREKKAKIELENARLKIENAEAINQQLKQHIHPHFLFNSMSVLKSLINKNPDLAEEYIVRLSDFLRVSISSSEANLVKLSDEYKLCLDFLEMQKIRFGKAVEFSFDIPEEKLSTGYVPGFSLQVLLENAIKHNILTEHSPLKIEVGCQNGWLSVVNNVQKKLSVEHSTKLGLANLSDRYRIISGHDIKVEETESQFRVFIKILANESPDY